MRNEGGSAGIFDPVLCVDFIVFSRDTECNNVQQYDEIIPRRLHNSIQIFYQTIINL